MTMAVGLSTAAVAQNNVLRVKPANDSSGKLLTMEEVILSRDLSPQRAYGRFEGDKLIYVVGDSFYRMDLASGEPRPIGQYTSPKKPNLPEGAYNIVYGKDENVSYSLKEDGATVYCYNDKNGQRHVIASSEDDSHVYGETVSRNEFGIDGGTFWSPDGKKIAYYDKDQSLVSTFPLLDIQTRTGSLREIRYPMAGMPSERIALKVYDLVSESSIALTVNDFTCEQYLTNISWSPDSRFIYIQVLDRDQKNMHLNKYDAITGEFVKTILEEHNDKYVEPLDPIYFVKGSNEFIYRTNNRDGYRNLYLCNDGGVIRRLTAVDADVQYVSNDGLWLYYTSAEVSPVENHLFRINFRKPKKAQRLTPEEGWHSVEMNTECTWFIDTYSNVCDAGASLLRSTDGKVTRTLVKSEDPTKDYAYSEIDFGTVKSADGKYDNYYRLIKPMNFDPSKKYPVIVYVYGGPHSQLVRNNFLASLGRWEMYMAQRGYLVYIQDNRGTENRGLEYEQTIHRNCGKAEMADQMVGVNMLMDLPYVDKDRIGVHGWSYGGFMTISLKTAYPEIFKVAVAGGPVIDWKWYEVMYGERYMETPQANPEGYASTSLINKAKDLTGKLLICQGAIDDTVVWEHSLSYVRECVKNNIQLDYFPYPCHPHNVRGKDRIHLMDKVTMYFDDYLK